MYAWIFPMKQCCLITLMCEVLQASYCGYFRQNACALGDADGIATTPCWLTSSPPTSSCAASTAGRVCTAKYWPAACVCKEWLRRLIQRHGIRAKGRSKFAVTTDSAHRLRMTPDLSHRQLLTWCEAAK